MSESKFCPQCGTLMIDNKCGNPSCPYVWPNGTGHAPDEVSPGYALEEKDKQIQALTDRLKAAENTISKIDHALKNAPRNHKLSTIENIIAAFLAEKAK